MVVCIRKRPFLQQTSYEAIHYDANLSVVLETAKAEYDTMTDGKVIVFVRGRELCRRLAEAMQQYVPDSFMLVGGTDVDMVRSKSDDFLRTRKGIMFATSCFGLGVDVPNVRLVIVVDLPFEMESLVQMFGRAGRDGGRAKCVLFWNRRKEEATINGMIRQRESAFKVSCLRNLLTAFCAGQTCRRQVMAEYINGIAESCLHLGELCQKCDVCLSGPSLPQPTVQKDDHFQKLSILMGMKKKRDVSFAHDVLYVMRRIQYSCFLCSVRQKELVNHTFEDHCEAEQLCWKCFAPDHFQASCRLKDPRDCDLKDVCYRCLCPAFEGDVRFHDADYTENCSSNVALGLAMACRAVEHCHPEKTKEEFYQWLLVKTDGFVNAIRFMVDWYERTIEQ
jgi:superfamily II DNA helicase RecQ